MENIEEFIAQSSDVRELKRALCVQLEQAGLSGTSISQILQVSPQFVSKWQKIYEEAGLRGLKLGYQGSDGYLTDEQTQAVLTWIGGHVTLTLEELVDYLATTYGVVYQSRQSYYALLNRGGLTYHKTEKVNPKRNEEQVQAQQEVIKKNWRRSGMRSNVAR